MKATNHFDYPTASATTYKGYRPEEAPKSDKKALYQRVLKKESQSEREKAQQEQQRRKEVQTKQQQNRIREEIQRKRNQLLELERRKQQALENQRRAEQLANIKMQQDKIKRLEQQQQAKQNDENANYRFRQALRRLDVERQELNYRQRQAQLRRKTNQEVEKQERQQAIHYGAYLKEKEEEERLRTEKEQRDNEEVYRVGAAKHGFARNVDYSKTCFHNPQLVFKYEEEQQQANALLRGEDEQRRRKELSQQKREREAEARRKSLERGQKAVQRVEAEREYRAYVQQTEKEQRDYNLQRIQVGKKNQYTGLKPLTLQQIELNKKARSEQQFEQLFVGSREPPSRDFASKYTILEVKYAPLPQNNISHSSQTQRQEDSLEIYNPAYQQALDEQEEDSEIEQRKIMPAPTAIEDKRYMAETRAEDGLRNNPREELSYSESEDDY